MLAYKKDIFLMNPILFCTWMELSSSISSATVCVPASFHPPSSQKARKGMLAVYNSKTECALWCLGRVVVLIRVIHWVPLTWVWKKLHRNTMNDLILPLHPSSKATEVCSEVSLGHTNANIFSFFSKRLCCPIFDSVSCLCSTSQLAECYDKQRYLSEKTSVIAG